VEFAVCSAYFPDQKLYDPGASEDHGPAGNDFIWRRSSRSDVFPVQRFEEACHSVLEEHGTQAPQYGATEGYEPLREIIAQEHGARYGILAKAENVLITSGSQQALDLIGKLLIASGAT